MTTDAVLLIGFGGPEGPQDVLPFLRRVTAGRGIPDERLAEVGRHYEHFGGVSPINQFHRELLERWRPDLAQRWPGLPLYWGNRNAPPFLTDALTQMRAEGVQSAVAVVTSAFSSYSGCRQYREDISGARAEVDDAASVVKAPPFFDHPLMVDMWADSVRGGLAQLADRSKPLVLFSTHSIPTAAARAAGPGGTGAYESQHRELAAAVIDQLGEPLDWDLCYQSRSGPPQQPWLEPDVSDRLATAAQAGVSGVVLVPLGFVSDHIEVLWDLDEVALTDARALGLQTVRTPTVGTDERFITVLSDAVAAARGEASFPSFRQAGPLAACPSNCCLPVRPRRPSGTMAP